MQASVCRKVPIVTQILGVRFSSGNASELVQLGVLGGLVVVPSAPVLVESQASPTLSQALKEADLAIADSGLMILLWRIFTGERLERVSGLEYLKELLKREELRRPGALFWVMPSAQSRERNISWLRSCGLLSPPESYYVAPIYGYGPLQDEMLLLNIKRSRPDHIIIALGGGVQERLGLFLRSQFTTMNVPYRPGIHCIGAAIGFLNGDQVKIPAWADYLYLGWLCRCFAAPRRFVPRYWRALRLISLMLRFREKSPA